MNHFSNICDFCGDSHEEQIPNLKETNENICPCCADSMSEEVLNDWYNVHTTNPENYETVKEVMEEINQF